MNVWLCFLLFVLGCSSLLILAQENMCPKLTLKNGRVRMRGAGRMAYFRCKKKFKRVGHKLAVCLSGRRWSQQTPVCVGRGCPDLGPLPDVTVTEKYNGGVLQFSCPEDMRREGPQQLMCDGTNWNKEPPKCLHGDSPGCDFEDAGLCGWIQDSDDDFDWTWTSGSTPTTKTGPDGDHTTGSGHYLFMESSAPQKAGHIARLISPTYHPTSEEMCLDFFYHMKGPKMKHEVGDLDVYIRTTSAKDVSIFHRNSYQGDHWIKGQVNIPQQNELYRIVFSATRRQSWTGDIALDDIRTFNCSEKPPESEQTTLQLSTVTSTTTTPITMRSSHSPKTVPTKTSTKLSTRIIKTTSIAKSSVTNILTATPSTTTTIQLSTSTTSPIIQATLATSTTPDLPTWIPSVATLTKSTSTPKEPRQTNFVGLSTSTSTRWTPNTTASIMSTKTLYKGTTSAVHTLQTTISDGDTNGSSSQPRTFSGHSSLSYSTMDITSVAFSQTVTKHNIDMTSTHTQTAPSSSTEDLKPGKAEEVENNLSTNGKDTVSNYLPLIVGVSLAVVVGLAVVGVLAWMWARNRRKQKELRVEEDQLNIIGSIEASSYCYPPSGSEH